MAIFVPLILSTLALGLQPNAVFNITELSVDQLVAAYRVATGG